MTRRAWFQALTGLMVASASGISFFKEPLIMTLHGCIGSDGKPIQVDLAELVERGQLSINDARRLCSVGKVGA
jgi:hypothetical protein